VDSKARYLWVIALSAVLTLPRGAAANGADLPPEVVLQGFAKPEDGRLRLLVRVPLVLLSSFGLPKRGPGYLDLAAVDEPLKQAAAATGRQIELREDGVPLVPSAREARISLLSDRSFASYGAALAHLQGARLPIETDLFWNQGFFDTLLEYPLRSPSSHLSIRMNVAPELGRRLKLQLEFLPDRKPARSYVLRGGSGWIALDPRWYEAAWLFARTGFVDAISLERFVFLLCLVAPFRHWRSLLALVLALSALQALTLTATAQGAVATRWLAEISGLGLAATVVLFAIGNLGAPNLRRRWFLSAVVGSLGGFGLGALLADAWQFAGAQTVISLASFNIGVVLVELASAALAFAAVRLLFARVLGPPLGVVVLSAVLGHAAWHWMIDRGHQFGHELDHAGQAGLGPALMVIALWLLPALVAGAIAWFLPRRFDEAPVASLLAVLRRNGDGRPTRD